MLDGWRTWRRTDVRSGLLGLLTGSIARLGRSAPDPQVVGVWRASKGLREAFEVAVLRKIAQPIGQAEPLDRRGGESFEFR